MFPKEHIIYSTILCAALFPLFKWNVIIIFLVSVILIDIDHYIWFVQKTKDYHIKSVWRYYQHLLQISKRKCEYVLHVFHTVEFWMLIILLAFVSQFFVYVAIGISYHVLLDHIYCIQHNPLQKRANSIIEWLLSY
jgi:hypothetical protein